MFLHIYDETGNVCEQFQSIYIVCYISPKWTLVRQNVFYVFQHIWYIAQAVWIFPHGIPVHPTEPYRDDINIWYILWYVYFRHILYTDNQVNTIVVGRQNISNHGINSSPAGQNGRHFADDVFRCILVNEKFILIKISLNFVPKCPIDDKPAFVQIMAWRRTGDKPLSEPMMTRFIDAYVRH